MTERNKPTRTCAHSLKTSQHVQIELARVYRRTKRGARQTEDGGFKTEDGMRLCQILNTLKQALEGSEFERRLSEMEAAVAKPTDVVKFTPEGGQVSGLAAYEKRLEQVGRTVNHRNARTIVIAVPTQLVPIEGSVENDVVVTEETRAAVDEMLQAIGAGEQENAIEIARYTIDGPPELISVT